MNCPELQKLFCVFALRSNRKKVRIRIASEGGSNRRIFVRSWEGDGYGSRAIMLLYFMLAIQLSFVRCAAILTPSTFHLNIHSRHIVVEFIVIVSED